MSFLFGSSGSAAKPFRAPGFEQQGELLNTLFTGNVIGANPHLQAGLQSQIDQLQQQRSGFEQQLAGMQAPSAATAGQGGAQIFDAGAGMQLFNQQQGNFNQQISGLDQQIAQLEGSLAAGDKFQQQLNQIPELSFDQRDPFQFQQSSFDPRTAVGDAFTPQLQAAQAAIGRQGVQQREGITEDLNRRGLLTAGATTEALGSQREAEQATLGQIAGRLAGQQAQQQLGASQFAAQQDFQRQAQQAQELFRQAGATDQQAISMANQSLQAQQFQNILQRQPQEDLMRLFGVSTGGTPAEAAQPGLLQALAPAAGGFLGSLVAK